MFNFTTQTIFNNVVKATTDDIKNGSAAKDYNLIVAGENEVPFVRIGNTRFDKEFVESIFKASHTDEHLAKVEFDMAKILEQEAKDRPGSYRIAIYIRLSMNSQDSFYSNDFVYKGKPIYIEFPVKANDTAATIATRVAHIAKKYMLVMAQEKFLTVTANEGKVTIEGVNGYQQLTKAELQKFDPDAKMVSCCGHVGDYAVMVEGKPLAYEFNDGTFTSLEQTVEDGELRELGDTEVGIEPGLEAFLDYNWIMHNLRLPTLANTNIWAPTKNEQPVVGGKYNQYIIRICKERDGIAGEVVGQRATSVTTHVLYVLDNDCGDTRNVALVEAELEKLGKDIQTVADDKFAKPYAALQSTEDQNNSVDPGNGGNDVDPAAETH